MVFHHVANELIHYRPFWHNPISILHWNNVWCLMVKLPFWLKIKKKKSKSQVFFGFLVSVDVAGTHRRGVAQRGSLFLRGLRWTIRRIHGEVKSSVNSKRHLGKGRKGENEDVKISETKSSGDWILYWPDIASVMLSWVWAWCQDEKRHCNIHGIWIVCHSCRVRIGFADLHT